MTYKTPLHPEVQAALSVGVREAIQPLSKPDRLIWQPLLTSYTYSLAKDLQVREAQRAERSRNITQNARLMAAPTLSARTVRSRCSLP